MMRNVSVNQTFIISTIKNQCFWSERSVHFEKKMSQSCAIDWLIGWLMEWHAMQWLKKASAFCSLFFILFFSWCFEAVKVRLHVYFSALWSVWFPLPVCFLLMCLSDPLRKPQDALCFLSAWFLSSQMDQSDIRPLSLNPEHMCFSVDLSPVIRRVLGEQEVKQAVVQLHSSVWW